MGNIILVQNPTKTEKGNTKSFMNIVEKTLSGSRMEQTHSSWPFLLNAAIKPSQNAWSTI